MSHARKRESEAARTTRAGRIVRALRKLYPDAHCELDHRDPLELLVATILSAQCTDQRVNLVTPALFARYRSAADFAGADPDELQGLIRPTGFFRNKARSIIGLGRALALHHRGQVPRTMEELTRLPGVGRKTANVLLGTWFEEPAIPVDTHVQRVAKRLALTSEDDPVKIEFALQRVFPEKDWTFASTALIWHGRRVCFARTPNCPGCALRADCPFPAPR